MKYAEIKHLQEPELRKRLAQTRQTLFDSRMKHKMQRLSNMMDLRNLKRDKARLETALSVLVPPPALPVDKETAKGVKISPESAFKSALTKKPTKPWAEKEKQARKDRAKEKQAQLFKVMDETQKETTEADKKTTPEPKLSGIFKKIKKGFSFFNSAQKDKKQAGKKSFFPKKRD